MYEDEFFKTEQQARQDSFANEDLTPYLLDKYGLSALPDFIKEYLAIYFAHHSDPDTEEFLRYVQKERPFLELELWQLANDTLEKIYLSETPHVERFDQRESLSLRGERGLLKFRLTSPADLYTNSFMRFDDFFSTYVWGNSNEKNGGSLKMTPYAELKTDSVQIFRIGVVRYYDAIFEQLSPEEGVDFQEYLQGFVDFFSKRRKGISFFLNQHLSSSLEETIWLAQKMHITTPAIEDFCDLAQVIGLGYVKSNNFRQRNHPAKYQNKPEDNELASYFEHFMGVVRLCLGYIQSLAKNTIFTECEFLKQLQARPDYLLETIYTALLHDVIEDKEFETKEVEGLLLQANLKPGLISQILGNLNLLNSKRLHAANGISTEEYVAEIMNSNNPVVELVKFSDIIHNNKDVHKKSKFGKKGAVKNKWLKKREAYAPLVKKIMDLPIHMRTQDSIAILNSNPELMQMKGWASLVRSMQKAEIIEGLTAPVKKEVEKLLSA